MATSGSPREIWIGQDNGPDHHMVRALMFAAILRSSTDQHGRHSRTGHHTAPHTAAPKVTTITREPQR